jgi:hypothetical protein
MSGLEISLAKGNKLPKPKVKKRIARFVKNTTILRRNATGIRIMQRRGPAQMVIQR